jgi:PHP family Zn ribbon phosphoesterase
MNSPSVRSSELLLTSTRIEQLLRGFKGKPSYYVDIHVHSKYSRATSADMTLENIAFCARLKGLNIVGTGDCTHPRWLRELEKNLIEEEPGLYRLRSEKNPEHATLFLIQGEVSTVYQEGGMVKRIHHVVLFPSLETVKQACESLKHMGDLSADGRPLLKCSSPELVEILKSFSEDIEVFPAHVWTPHFSIFGVHGYTSVKECYKDKSDEIHALETGLSCYDEKTEVLTEDGWKKFSEVKPSDKIYTLNPKTNEIELQHPRGIFSYRYEGRMYRLKTRRVDLLVTPNHNLFITTCDLKNPKPFFLEQAREVFGKSKRFKKNGKWNGNNEEYFTLPSVEVRHGNQHYSGLRRIPEKKIPMKDWLKFFGFWLAEGWTTRGKNGDYNVCISCTDKKLVSEMKKLLQSFGYRVFQDKKYRILRVRSYQLFTYLEQFGKCHEKSIPKDVKMLSKDLLKILLDYYLKGDGHIYGRTNKGLSATTTSTRLRDDLQEIALKVGISAYFKLDKKKGTPLKGLSSRKKTYRQSNDSWTVYFIRKNTYTVIPSSIRKNKYIERWVDFKGRVYCVSVPNKVIYVRRSGIPIWCGNSDPLMNWRVSRNDRYTLVSNSDSHSYYPWRLGREANLMLLEELSYREVLNAIRREGRSRIILTVETFPEYGKYHYPGHRGCGVSVEPDKYFRLKGICPVCSRKLTAGVETHIEELADRPRGIRPRDASDYVHLIPLSEIIGYVYSTSPNSKKAWSIYYGLIREFGSEYRLLIETPVEEIEKRDKKLAHIVEMVRNDRVRIRPGYDGVYGEIEGFYSQNSLAGFLE